MTDQRPGGTGEWGPEGGPCAPPGACDAAALGALHDPLTDPLPQAGPLADPMGGPFAASRNDPLTGPLPDPLHGPLADPLNDPLTGPLADPQAAAYPGAAHGLVADPVVDLPAQPQAPYGGPQPVPETPMPGDGYAYGGDQQPYGAYESPGRPGHPGQGGGVGVNDPETVGLRRPDDLTGAAGGEPDTTPPAGGRAARRRAARAGLAAEEHAAESAAAALDGREADDRSAEPAPGGRAARRRAAQAGQSAAGQGGGRAARRKAAQAGRGSSKAAAAAAALAEAQESGGRAARRRAAKAAAKAARQTGTAISNVIGELFITTGVLLLLFVVYQVWWTNLEAKAHANHEADNLEQQWEQQDSATGSDEDRDPGQFAPGEGFAILYLPTLDVRVPIAETVDKSSILDNGMVGHYTEADGLPTAMPWDEEGNFGLAGHRNTHGEPFRYINRLQPGDPVVVETQNAFYTYEVRNTLESTPPSNISVLDPIPPDSGFTEPGRYITLTTCTPEFQSTYRLIVWGEMTEERPRSEGMPDALVN